MTPSQQRLASVAAAFGLELEELLTFELPGSPARTVYRCIVQSLGEPYILEEVASASVPRKREIAAAVARLYAQGLTEALPFLETVEGEHIFSVGESHWMAERYVPSDPLPRPDWVDEAARGEALAAFMRRVRQATASWQWAATEVWRLELWLPELVTSLRRHDPAVLRRVRAPLRLAQQALLQESQLAVAWAHGDLHPLNVLWRGMAVDVVIDWEFTGPKAALFDLANLLGCVGIESPAALTGAFALAAVRQLRQGNYLDDASWQALPAYLLALRFAWLSEWLRMRDQEMITLECDYLDLLLARQDALLAAWAA